MAKLGDLVVRIGADTRGLNKSLGKVQRNMRSMTSNFTKLGTSMSKSITLPLLGIAAMAVKSAADLEKMETGFISLAGGAEEAGAMMKQLNDFTAKTPFQIEAVATAARQLIASGTGIGEVNEQLQFLGDIAATTGQPINEIAAIFAKVNAKGKVELENLNQLAERGIPVFKGLADATGLLPSELGAGAVTVQQFNDYLKGLSKEGGFAEGAMERLSQTASGKFSTALDNLKLAGASLAESLLPILSDLLDYVVDLAQSFVDLSPSTKKMILIFGGVAAALGPLLVIIPQIIAGLPLITSAFVAMTGPIGLAVIGVTALIGTVAALVKANKDIPSTLERANAAVRDHSTEVRYLVGQYKDETKSLKDRETILNRLATIDATHFGNLTAENTTYNDLVKNLDNYTASLRRNYLEKILAEEGSAIMARLVRAEGVLRDKQIALQKAKDEERGEDIIYAYSHYVDMAKVGQANILTDLEAFEKKKQDLLEKYASATGPVTDETKDDEIETDEKGLVVIQPEQMELLEKLPPKLIAVDKPLKTLQDSGLQTIEIFKEVSQTMVDVADSFGTSFGQMIVGAETAKEAFRNFAISAIRSVLAVAKANVIANATSTANLANLFSAGLTSPGFALIGLAALDVLAQNIPALAEGGLAYGPTLAMVGDNKGASIDPEVVAPLSKLKGMLGGDTVQVYGRISGDDIVISNSRASRDRNRF